MNTEQRVKEERIETLVRSIYRKHDLSSDTYKDSIDDIISNCTEEIRNHPDIEVNNFFITQMILENY